MFNLSDAPLKVQDHAQLGDAMILAPTPTLRPPLPPVFTLDLEPRIAALESLVELQQGEIAWLLGEVARLEAAEPSGVLATAQGVALAGEGDRVALDWLPILADPWPRPRRPVGGAMVMNLDPIVNPPPPTELTWHPAYPDKAWPLVRLQPRLQKVSAQWLGPQVLDPRFMAVIPAWIARRRVHPSRQLFSPIGNANAAVNLGKLGGWRPVYPAWIARKRPVRQGLATFQIDGQTLINLIDCIEVRSETVIEPMLTPETLTSATLQDETLIAPTLTTEDLC